MGVRRWLLWAPFLAFLILFGFVAIGLLRPVDRTVPSRLVGRAMPTLQLPALVANHPAFRSAARTPRLVNIFASWCGPCAAEVVQLQRLKGQGVVIDGIAVRDTEEDLSAFLRAYGDPYRAIGNDRESRSMIALGSSGVPESFIVDARGIIRHQHVGAIGEQDFDEVLRAYRAAR